jgi:putative acetyltransferase
MSLVPPNGVSLRPFLPSDIASLVELIQASIYELASEDYSSDQCTAWCETLSDEAKLAERLSKSVTLLALHEDEPCGFIALKDNTTIDLIYTAPHFAQKGVATFLCGAIELLATGRKSTKLIVDASDTAIPLFTKLKFTPVQRNTVTINGQWLANTTMQKELNPNSAPPTTQ